MIRAPSYVMVTFVAARSAAGKALLTTAEKIGDCPQNPPYWHLPNC
jgi:hypothetical protein